MRYAFAMTLLFVCVSGFAQNPLDANPFAGRFVGENFVAEFQAGNGGYVGTLTLNGQAYPATATVNGNTLSGKFTSGGSEFSFTATIDGDRLSFSSGSSTRVLSRATQAAEGNPPAGYEVVNETQFGKTLAAKKPAMPSVKAALMSALPELSRNFDAAPQVLTAYEDTRDPSVGGATFVAMAQGKRVNGWISCKLSPQGTIVAVVYCRADAPAGEAARLLAPPKPQGRNQPIQLHEYRFPDGTGSIGLAEGWTTDAPSMMQVVIVKGPAHQEIGLGSAIPVNTPDSLAVQTQMQLIENARQMGMPPPNLQPMMVAPFTGPAEAMQNLAPQAGRIVWQTQGIFSQIDNLQEVAKLTPSSPGSQAAVLTYGLTYANRGEERMHYRVIDQIECTPILQGSWLFKSYAARAPDATFEQDLPVMLAIAGSLRENAEVIVAKTQENLDAMNRRFAAQQKAHQEVVQAYENYNHNWEKNQNIQSRSMDNFSEAMRGYRTVEDTTTGEKTQVDLGHVDQVVDRLNEADPGRYRQIPLRDEMDPLPGSR